MYNKDIVYNTAILYNGSIILIEYDVDINAVTPDITYVLNRITKEQEKIGKMVIIPIDKIINISLDTQYDDSALLTYFKLTTIDKFTYHFKSNIQSVLSIFSGIY